MLGLEFPPINALLRWKDFFPTFNKIALIAVLAAVITIVIFYLAGSKDGTIRVWDGRPVSRPAGQPPIPHRGR